MEKGSFIQEFIAGNVGGLIGICVVYPLDTAKIRMQTHSSYKSTSDVLRRMVINDGLGSVYRGIASPALGFGLTFAISFSAYGYSCRQIAAFRHKVEDSLTYLEMTLAGVVTGFAQSPVRLKFSKQRWDYFYRHHNVLSVTGAFDLIINCLVLFAANIFRQVIERVKSVMQVIDLPSGKSPYSWSGNCAVYLVREHGVVNGLFQGMGSVLLREVPQFAVYYPWYEFARRKGLEHGYFSPIVVQALAGGTAGVVQWLPPFYFFDVIKSRMQTSPKGLYRNVFHCAEKLYKEEGPRVFFRGLSPALLRAFPLHALIFVFYELTILQLKKL